MTAAKVPGNGNSSLECYHCSFGSKITMRRRADGDDQPGARTVLIVVRAGEFRVT
jgi:hypothetical protein